MTLVKKTGRSTGQTFGLLSGRGSFKVTQCGKDIKFKDCFQIMNIDRRFCEKGDSGAGVFLEETENNKALGMIIAEAKEDPYTLVCDVKHFLEECHLELYIPTEPIQL